MYELVLAVSFLTSGCALPGDASLSPRAPVQIVSLTGQHYPGPRHDVSLDCGANWQVTYRYVDTYRNLNECMKRVARIGEADGVRGVCRATRR